MKFACSALRLASERLQYPLRSNLRREIHKNTTLSSNLPHPHLDYKSISENAAYKTQNIINRKAPLSEDSVQSAVAIHANLRAINSELGRKLALRNATTQLIQDASDPIERTAAIEDAKLLRASIAEIKSKVSKLEEDLLDIALRIPNDTHPDVPIGPDEAAIVLSTHGPDPLPASALRDHVVTARSLEMLELDAAAIATGSSWYYLLNEGALLEMALTDYAMSIAMKHNYRPIITPDVVKADVAMRCGFQPRDVDVQQMYHLAGDLTKPHSQLVLSGTAEIPLAAMFSNRVYEEIQLPLKVVGLGRAFRAEAGAKGTDTRGLYRVHQFTKVELFAVTAESQSDEMLEDMRKIQVEILDGLRFPFRVLDMPTEELGVSAYRKYDIEAWMPGRGKWGEVTSTSNCTDFQSRRLYIRYRPQKDVSVQSPDEKRPLRYVHTINGTAAAIPRLIVAILENGVRLEGDSVVGLDLPEVLRPFWVGKGSLSKKEIRWV